MKTGLFVTCLKNKQRSSYNEILSIIDLKEPEQNYSKENDTFDNTVDIKEIMIKEIRKPKSHLLETFKNIPNIFFMKEKIAMSRNGLQKTQYLHEISDDIRYRHTCKIRYMDFFGQYSDFREEDLIDTIKNNRFLETQTFKITYKQRCSDFNIKDSIFKIILEACKDLTVNLTNPDMVIEIQVIKCFIGFGVVCRNKIEI